MTHFQKHTHRKQRPLNVIEKAGMATLLAKIRELRQRAVNEVAPDRQNTPVKGRTRIE